MIRSALAIDPEYAPAWRNLGLLQESQGDTTAAIVSERRAFAADPYFASAGVDLARMLFARGDNAETERVLREVLARQPRDEHALWNLAVLLGTRLGRTREASVLVERLLQIHPGHPNALRLKGYLQAPATTPAWPDSAAS